MNENDPDNKKHSYFSLEGLMYQSRWLLYPVNCGLMIALAIFVARFLWHIGILVFDAPSLITAGDAHANDLMIAIVDLLDQAMVAALLILTIMGGHQIYIRKLKFENRGDGPEWLDHIDTITLKVKVGLAFVGVSSVLLLEDAISVVAVPREVWMQHLIIHSMFLATTLIIAVVWRIMRVPARPGE